MGKFSRDKGARGEREFIRVVERLTEGQIVLSRNLSQSRDGGDDCLGHDNCSIEIKRRKQVTDADITNWWAQAVHQAAAIHKQPVLAYRRDFQCWRVLIHPNHLFPLDDVRGCLSMDVELFCQCLLDKGGLGVELPLSYYSAHHDTHHDKRVAS